MSLFKHLVNILAMPLAMASLLGALAGIWRLCGWRRAGKSLMGVAAAIAYLGSIEPVGKLLLEPLESQYPPLVLSVSLATVGYVVVLGDDYQPGNGIPVSAALNDDGLKRIVAAVGLMRRLNIRVLVVSGGAQPGHAPSALGYATFARELGVPEDAIVISDRALDTGAEAHAVKALLGNQPFVLVTSAYHMPRAIKLMERAGAHPIPAPAGQRVRGSQDLDWRNFLPGGGGLSDSERALHEYIGLVALALGFE